MELNEKDKIGWLRELLELGFGKQLIHVSTKINEYHPMLRAERNVDIWATLEIPSDDKSMLLITVELYELFAGSMMAVSTDTSYVDNIKLVKIHFVGIGGLDNTLKTMYQALKERFDERFNTDLEELLQQK